MVLIKVQVLIQSVRQHPIADRKDTFQRDSLNSLLLRNS